MEWIALLFALAAFILFLFAAKTNVPGSSPNWHFGWLGLACLTVSLSIWHVVAPLESIIKNT